MWKRINHENILPLLGTAENFGRHISLVSPWMDNGDLIHYMSRCGDGMNLLRRLHLVISSLAFVLGLLTDHGHRLVELPLV